ncbi:MAG: hypothetical protein AB8I08_32190 [Sandaracinaceae bacterium]
MGLLQSLSTTFGDDLRRAALFGRSSVAALRQGISMSTMSWDAICRHDDFRGRWVALDQCRYDGDSGRAMEGAVVDVDDDLIELCNRMRESEHTNCAILFCGEDGAQEPPAPPADDEDPFRHSAH